MANELYKTCKSNTNLEIYSKEDKLNFYELAKEDLEHSKTKIQIA